MTEEEIPIAAPSPHQAPSHQAIVPVPDEVEPVVLESPGLDDAGLPPAGGSGRASWMRRLFHWAARTGLEQKFTLGLAIAAILSGLATYITASGSSPFEASPSELLLLLYINFVMLLVFGAVVAKRLVEIWVQRRRGLAGSRLHIRLVVLFSAVAVTPAIIVGIFSYLFLGIGMTSWFSDKVHTALTESRAVAQAYLQEHQQNIRADALAMAADLNREGFKLVANRRLLDDLLDAEVNTRQLTESIVFDRYTRQVLGSSTLSFGLQFEPIPDWAVQRADSDEVAVLTSENEDRVRALIKLDNMPNAMLYVGRPIERRVIDYVKKTTEAVDQYQQLEGQRSVFQIKFVVIYGCSAMLLLLVAVWVGLNFATGISRRISGLIVAAERVRGGDLSARVTELGNDEFGSLRRAFNRMTDQLESQQSELVEANRQLDYRRRFTEAVLTGVSAGVIGLDEHGVVTLPNRPAALLLGLDFDQMLGQPLARIMPDMAPLIDLAIEQPTRRVEGQIRLMTQKNAMTLLVRITAETGQGEIKGYVVTFDDITELLSAQRKAAWADVARRIAHEIKNPLTPIQLSAERLKRKYLAEIKSDPETFSLCTDTIIRQVGDIGRMVDEFSSFARMPAPVMREESLTEIARQAVFLQRTANGDMDFDMVAPDHPVLARCDSRQVSQALINLVQNAVDSIQGRAAESGGNAAVPRGHITVEMREEGGKTAISVTDNGKGLPKEARERLTEPYVTTRTKGTGLGLAIVKKIMEDHAGELILEDAPEGGARVSLVFSRGDALQAAPASKQDLASMPRMEVEPHGA